MIFISHTKDDKPLVEPIALRMTKVFGSNSVFYDSWSIQPGDDIVERMNEALSKCKFFFFFVSKNSLQSNLVKLEWQNAIIKATKGESKANSSITPRRIPLLVKTIKFTWEKSIHF